jgi:hypothetical protein
LLFLINASIMDYDRSLSNKDFLIMDLLKKYIFY